MPDIEFVRGEIQRTRLQVLRQRREIMQLQRAGLNDTLKAIRRTTSASWKQRNK
jgi:hypothetical protein